VQRPRAANRMADILDRKTRSYVMSRIRKTGNRSTELRAIEVLRTHGIRGWICHPRHIPGTPDLYFPAQRLAVFLQGCFWHGCASCGLGKLPKSRREYWIPKLASNRIRDARIRRTLQRAGYRTTWIWEHELKGESWLPRLLRRLETHPVGGRKLTRFLT
jgi:DNA mismatch endonuclease (patch repair protein)